MQKTAASAILRSLDRIREEGRGLDVVEFARRILAVSGSLEPSVARRLVAAALECPADAVPDRLEPATLTAARHGLLGGGPAGRAGPAEPLSVPLARATFTVVDLETTGLSPERCAILEIGAVRVEAASVTARFETLVNPGVPVPRRISDLTGIAAADLADAPPSRPALRAFCRWLAETPRAAFVAHNARFDAGFLRRGFEAHDLPPLRGPVLCTRLLGRRLVPELRVYNLDALSAHFGIANRSRHRALGDAESTARALIELLALAEERERISNLGELLELQDRPPRPAPRPRRRAGARPTGLVGR